jgi:hypothetical protein
MKRFTLRLMTALLLLSFIPMQMNAVTGASIVATSPTTPVESAEVTALTTRLNEIKEIDRSKLNSAEKKQLRKEVRSIKSQLKAANGGVYLSIGAIIIIVLLLILLL